VALLVGPEAVRARRQSAETGPGLAYVARIAGMPAGARCEACAAGRRRAGSGVALRIVDRREPEFSGLRGQKYRGETDAERKQVEPDGQMSVVPQVD